MKNLQTIRDFLGEKIMARKEHLVTSVLAQTARETPDKIYLRHVDGDMLTYSQFYDQTLIWADALRRQGVKQGDRVMIMLPTSFDALVAGLAPAWLKAMDVNINTAFVGKWLLHIMQNSGSEIMIVGERYLDRLQNIDPKSCNLKTVIVTDATGPLPDLPFTMMTRDEFLEGATPDYDLEGPEPWDDFTVGYTSGTTGVSKGVVSAAGGVAVGGLTYWPPDGISPDDIYYIPYPTFHSSGRGQCYTVLLGRASCVIRERFSTQDYWADICKYGCTVTMMLGAIANFVYQQPETPEDKDNPLRAVFMVPVVKQIEDFKRRFGCQVWTGFGGTDLSSPIKSGFVDETNWNSCGKLREGYEVRIVDEHDREVPVGEPGEAIIRADQPWVLNCRYFGMPEKTVEAWRNGWMHSGDGLKQDEDGNFYFVDRIKDVIRRRGENVSSFEVEAEVNKNDAVLESAAIAVPSEWGEDEIKIVIVLHQGQSLTGEALIEFLIPRVPRFAIPRYVEFVEELPKTPTEKVRKVELRENAFNDRTWDREKAGIKLPK